MKRNRFASLSAVLALLLAAGTPLLAQTKVTEKEKQAKAEKEAKAKVPVKGGVPGGVLADVDQLAIERSLLEMEKSLALQELSSEKMKLKVEAEMEKALAETERALVLQEAMSEKMKLKTEAEIAKSLAKTEAAFAYQLGEKEFAIAAVAADKARFAIEAALAGGFGWAAQDVKLTEDEEMQMYALNGMRNANPEEAVPLLEKFLKGNHRMPLKERALSVLASFDTKQARDVIVAVARDTSNPDLQLRSLRYLGRMESEASRQALIEIYGSTQNKDAKRTVLRSLQNAEDAKRVLALAKTEQDPEIRGYAGRQLGSMNARAELRQLVDAEKDVKAKTEMIRGLAAAEDVEKLTDVARKDPDPAIRREAIRRMTAIDSAQTSDVLVALYGTEKELDVRKEVISALARREDAKNVVALARAETNPELKKYAVSLLTRMRSKEANDYLLELLNK